jgi:hypothetical protein
MKLPNPERAIIAPEKIRDYLLSPDHPVGRFKARLFRAMGYRREAWQRLESDIRSLLDREAIMKEKTVYGQKYEIKGEVTTPSGRVLRLTSAWIITDDSAVPRFITAYPGEPE